MCPFSDLRAAEFELSSVLISESHNAAAAAAASVPILFSDMGFDLWPVSALIAFKRAVIEDPHSALADWTDADGNACDWHGVICSSAQGSVISL